MTKLDQAMRKLQAEARAATPPSVPNAALLAEFASVRTRRQPLARWFAVAALVAAGIAFVILRNVTPAPATRPAPVPVQVAAVQAPAPVLAEHPVARRPGRRKPSAPEPEEPFIPVPYTAPLLPGEHADVVRAEIPLSALIAAGFPIEVSDPGARARADLVIGPDGRTRAVRLISVSDSTSYRSIP